MGAIKEMITEMSQANYDMYHDPGHGWLKVPIRYLSVLGIVDKVSKYSYCKGGFAYLEEDCDAGLFLNTLQSRGIVEDLEHLTMFGITHHYSNETSPIKGYTRFTERSLWWAVYRRDDVYAGYKAGKKVLEVINNHPFEDFGGAMGWIRRTYGDPRLSSTELITVIESQTIPEEYEETFEFADPNEFEDYHESY